MTQSTIGPGLTGLVTLNTHLQRRNEHILRHSAFLNTFAEHMFPAFVFDYEMTLLTVQCAMGFVRKHGEKEPACGDLRRNDFRQPR